MLRKPRLLWRLAKYSLVQGRSSWFSQSQRVPVKPAFVSLAVAETCFFRCKHCQIWKLRPASDWMKQAEMKKTIDKLYEWLGEFNLAFSGGETFLNQGLIELIKYASEKGVRVHVNSNGYLIDQKLAARIARSGINSLHISVDGVGAIHDRTRGKKGAFKRAEQALKWLVAEREKSGQEFEIGTTTILMRSNVKRLEQLYDWGEKLGLDKMYFQALGESFAVKKHEPEWFKTSQCWPERGEAVKAIKGLIKLKKAGGKIGSTLSELEDYLSYYQAGPIKFAKKRKCFVGARNFSIAMNGDVRLCFFFEPVGNVLREKPEQIWNGERARRQRLKISRCQRGCRVLMCNRKLTWGDIVEKAKGVLSSD